MFNEKRPEDITPPERCIVCGGILKEKIISKEVKIKHKNGETILHMQDLPIKECLSCGKIIPGDNYREIVQKYYDLYKHM